MRRLSLALLILILMISERSAAQQTTGSLVVPVGGGYTGVYAGFSDIVLENTSTGPARMLVLPLGYASSADSLAQADREKRMQDAAEAAYLIEEACNQAAGQEGACTVQVAPILVRRDALDPEVVDYFTEDLSAIFILGGDPELAMHILRATPVDLALTALYESGVIVAGSGTGAGLLSVQAIGGYQPGFSEASSLQSGAVDIWHTPERRGLSFGLTRAVIEPYFYQRGHFGRLLNAMTLPGAPRLGIGVDANTGVSIRDGIWLEDVFGRYTITILDAETYRSTDFPRQQSCQPEGSCPNVVSLRNVLVHMLAPGDFTYDLDRRAHSMDPPGEAPERSFRDLALPPGAGPLYLAGDLSGELDHHPIISSFVQASGGEQARLAVIAAGFPSDSSAQRAADRYAASLGVPAQALIIRRNQTQPPPLRTGYTGILFVAYDASRLELELLASLKEVWLAGTPLLLDNAAAAVAGEYYAHHGPTSTEGLEAENALQGSFLRGRTRLRPGLGLLAATIEVQVLADNRWGRLFSLAYNQPELLALGLNSGSGIEVRPGGPLALGANPTLVLDLGNAQRGLGTNQAFVIANGLLDVFAPGETVEPEPVGSPSQPTQAFTPTSSPLAVQSGLPATPFRPDTSSSPTQAGPIQRTEAAPGRQASPLAWLALPALLILLIVSGLVVFLIRRRS